MPHDMNGKLIEPGDVVKIPGAYGNGPGKKVGTVIDVIPGTDTCNLTVASLLPGSVTQYSATASKAELVLKANGTDPG